MSDRQNGGSTTGTFTGTFGKTKFGSLAEMRSATTETNVQLAPAETMAAAIAAIAAIAAVIAPLPTDRYSTQSGVGAAD